MSAYAERAPIVTFPPVPLFTRACPFGCSVNSGGQNVDRFPFYSRATGPFFHQNLQAFAPYHTPPGACLPVWCGGGRAADRRPYGEKQTWTVTSGPMRHRPLHAELKASLVGADVPIRPRQPPGCHSFARLGDVHTTRTFPNFYFVGACVPEARRTQGLVFGAAGRKCPSSRRASPVAGGPGGDAYEHRRKPGVHRRKPPGAFLVPFWASKKEHPPLLLKK